MGRAAKLKEIRRRVRGYPQLAENKHEKHPETGQVTATGRRAIYKHLKRKLEGSA